MAYQRNMAQGETMRLFHVPDQPSVRQTLTLHAHVMERGGEPLQAVDLDEGRHPRDPAGVVQVDERSQHAVAPALGPSAQRGVGPEVVDELLTDGEGPSRQLDLGDAYGGNLLERRPEDVGDVVGAGRGADRGNGAHLGAGASRGLR